MMMPPSPRNIAIIAGSGRGPRDAAMFCQKTGLPYIYLALKGFADTEFVPDTPHFFQIPLGNIGEMLTLLKTHAIQDVLCIGGVRRPSWSDFKMDDEGMRWLRSWGRRIFQGDNSLLQLVHEKISALGYRVIGLHELMPDLLPRIQGTLTQCHPTHEDLKDIHCGFNVLECLSPYDIGQAVMVHQGVILGIEGPEGTQAMIERCVALRNAPSGGIVVKAPKIHQNRVLDLPVIGPDTASQMIDKNASGLAIRAGGVMILDQQRVCDLLNQSSKFLYVL